MDLGIIITDYEVFSNVQKKYHNLAAKVNLQNHPLQYLYDINLANEQLSDENEEMEGSESGGRAGSFSLVNRNFSSDNPSYIANAYCSRFEIVES